MKNVNLFLVSCFLFLAASGCASFSANPYDYTIAGDTIAPESVIRASSEARNANVVTDVEVRERYTRLRFVEKCYEDYGPICLSFSGYSGGIYAPYDYTTMGLLAVANQNGSGEQIDATDLSAEVADAKARADLALNKNLKHALDHHNENKKEE